MARDTETDNNLIVFVCSNIGLSGTTKVFIKRHNDGTYEARMGFSCFGGDNMDEEGFNACDYNPFHTKFYDNYVTGIGGTEKEATDNLKKEMTSISESLWM